MSKAKNAVSIAPYRNLQQHFSKGKHYCDPRKIDDMTTTLQNVTFLDGDNARLFRDAELSGMNQFRNGSCSFRKRKITMHVWECMKN